MWCQGYFFKIALGTRVQNHPKFCNQKFPLYINANTFFNGEFDIKISPLSFFCFFFPTTNLINYNARESFDAIALVIALKF